MGIRILYNADTWDAGTITSNSEASTELADDNAVHDFVGKPWRSAGDTSEYWRNDLGSATNIKVVGIFNHNFTSAATVKLQANTTNSFVSPPFDQTLTVATDADAAVIPRIVVFIDETYQWWNLDVADAANPDGYIQIGRIMAGTYWEPARTISNGFQLMVADPSLGDRTPGTSWYARARSHYRRASVRFELHNRAQYDKFHAVFSKIGQVKPLVLALDPSSYATADSMYCKVETELSHMFREADLFDVPSLSFVEETE